MTPDEIEALNLKYSLRTTSILLLSSNRWALFDRRYRLHSIVDNPAEVLDFIRGAANNDPGLVSGNPNEPTPPVKRRLAKTAATLELLKELGL
tara:strand:+ start:45 stop:323 length:279 start_codon:yes stop_codon:yes gene_type:complete